VGFTRNSAGFIAPNGRIIDDGRIGNAFEVDGHSLNEVSNQIFKGGIKESHGKLKEK
jgi:hypothetical protein